MVKEIKFRAWDKYDGMFRDVVRIDYNSGKVEARWEEGDAPKAAGGFFAKGIKLLDMDALVEFIGLHDKNGAEIYDGDITTIGMTSHAVVEWCDEECRFMLYHPDSDEFSGLFNSENWCNIVGNRFENTVLVEA